MVHYPKTGVWAAPHRRTKDDRGGAATPPKRRPYRWETGSESFPNLWTGSDALYLKFLIVLFHVWDGGFIGDVLEFGFPLVWNDLPITETYFRMIVIKWHGRRPHLTWSQLGCLWIFNPVKEHVGPVKRRDFCHVAVIKLSVVKCSNLKKKTTQLSHFLVFCCSLLDLKRGLTLWFL